MPQLKGKKPWTEAEIVVLAAIFSSMNFSVGDDERQECRLIANEMGRSPGTVDRQWRNIKDYLAGMPCGKVGTDVKIWSDVLLEDPLLVKKLALYYCRFFRWNLERLLRGGK